MTKKWKADRLDNMQPFHVMDLLGKAKQLQEQGRDVIHLEVGEPDFPTPKPIVEAGIEALKQGELFYTPSLGLTVLREAVANHYQKTFGVKISPASVIITSGASGALLLSLGAILNPDDELMLCDPGYPCNSNFAYFLSAQVNRIAVGADTQYQLTAELVEKNWSENTKAVLIASPSNPTGTIVELSEIKKIYSVVKRFGGVLIVDEIYQGLVYDQAPRTALEVSQDLIVINSFSKYFQMTGWRLGWCIVPEIYQKGIDILSQNLFLSPSTPAQFAAQAAFKDETLKILETRREIFKQRRDFLYPELKKLGFDIAVLPQGAFYLYADCSRFSSDSMAFCHDLLDNTGVAITPGIDFGTNQANHHVRFAYTREQQVLADAVTRLKNYL